MGPNRFEQRLLAKIKRLPPNRAAAVEDFIDFPSRCERDGVLARATSRLSEEAFQEIWDNPDDADYDRL